MLEVEILGGGCSSCRQLELALREAISRTGVPTEIRKVTDFYQISLRGAMSLPALVVAGRVASAGRIPKIAEIQTWLLEGEARNRASARAAMARVGGDELPD